MNGSDTFGKALELMHQLENRVTELSASMQVQERVPGRRVAKAAKVDETLQKLIATLRRDARERKGLGGAG